MARDYETLYIINPQLEEEEIKNVIEKFNNLISESAQLKLTDEWGKRKLAYLVQDFNEGYYVLTEFNADPDFPQELERVFKITDSIIKYLIIKKD
jgi:small subunit ribosomal protein S6